MTYSKEFKIEVMKLHYEGISYQKIAERCGCHRNTVYAIVRDNAGIVDGMLPQSSLTITCRSGVTIDTLYHDVKGAWVQDHPGDPLPDFLITHDKNGRPSISIAGT